MSGSVELVELLVNSIERLVISYELGIVTNMHHAPLIWHHLNGTGIANAFLQWRQAV